MNLSDDEIIERVQRGERERFLELYRRHHRRLGAYARRQLRNAEAARDIVSETFLRAYQSVDSFRTGERISYPGYLFLVCRRLIINERERIQASPIIPLDDETADMAEELPDTAPLPLTQLLDAERRQRVREALAQLTHDDREIIYLAFERDLSRRDIMDILGKPSVSAVTSHLHRAMLKLQAVLVQQGYFASMRESERE